MIWANQTPQLRGEIDQDLIIEVEIVVLEWLICEQGLVLVRMNACDNIMEICIK